MARVVFITLTEMTGDLPQNPALAQRAAEGMGTRQPREFIAMARAARSAPDFHSLTRCSLLLESQRQVRYLRNDPLRSPFCAVVAPRPNLARLYTPTQPSRAS